MTAPDERAAEPRVSDKRLAELAETLDTKLEWAMNDGVHELRLADKREMSSILHELARARVTIARLEAEVLEWRALMGAANETLGET